MSASASDEVALDFQDVLDDLNINNRYEISNLTIIAKENIEHAQAISRTLEQHIRKVTPNKKLPSLYVLDSIVKNVGSPFTIYLGRNLFSTFMDAYTLVDANTRRAMESMLRTWKEPVPGSMEPTPVFPPETTRVIENALNKAKAVFAKTQPVPPRPSSATFRNTPTPPQLGGRGGPPPAQPSAQVAQSILAALGRPLPPQNDTAQLNADIEGLINTARADFAANVFDQSVQTRLKALLDLQTIMRTQQLPPDALTAIRAQVTALSSAPRPPSAAPKAPVQQWQPPNPASAPAQPPTNLAQIFQRPPSTQPAAPPAFAPGALEALLASTANGVKPSTPDLRQNLPPMPGLLPPAPGANGSAGNGAQAQSLIDALKAAGLAAGSTPVPPPILPPVPPPSTGPQSAADLLKSLSAFPGMNGFVPPPPPGFIPSQSLKPRIPLSQSGLKVFNPSLLATLYSAQPNQCPTCALRFPSTDAGKAAKAAHLDWHFRTNQRIADSVHRSLHRQWHPDEHAWLALKEVDFSVLTEAAADAAANPTAKVEARKYVPAPGGVSKSCPICQDPFQPEWSEEAQEWVWWDAVEKGGRVYHVSCLQEVQGGVLGKRKAEDEGVARARPV